MPPAQANTNGVTMSNSADNQNSTLDKPLKPKGIIKELTGYNLEFLITRYKKQQKQTHENNRVLEQDFGYKPYRVSKGPKYPGHKKNAYI
ncbi:hypothetical protein BB560_001066 [Smittium megazygosporum]|uniref:Uncharacterized protein n=1 Tax=Smittium megazygosporum TaxID=133381 RepID=A0A2T9ZIJ1_9FUNG|nr:hypothetical protein BB560_001066 [Smittium megazygosporum]